MRLIGDIGGTNARFAVVDAEKNIIRIENMQKKDFANFEDAINAYKQKHGLHFDEVVLAVNAPIKEGFPVINANNWGYENNDIVKSLQVERFAFFNDLKAHAMSLPFLPPEEIRQLKFGKIEPKGSVAIIGPGTGLGVAFGVFDEASGQHIFHPSEGGNQTAGAVGAEQLQILAKVAHVCPSVRWEDLCSGRGIPKIYQSLYDEAKTTEDIMADFAKDCPNAQTVFRHFCEFFGAFLHNIATMLLPSGGIYIVGGILSREENLNFLINHTDFGRFYYADDLYCTNYLDAYPIFVVTNPSTALVGLANYEF